MTSGVLKVELTASPEFCSDARIHFLVDGQLVQISSDWIDANESTGLVDLGPVTPHTHEIAVQAEGRVGGCNRGRR